MEKINVFDVQIPDGRQIRCMSYNKVTYILWNFSSDDDITIKNTCHESFHVAMSVCQFCNMSLGFKVGEDEHAAYIAGFAGGCAYDFLYSNSTE